MAQPAAMTGCGGPPGRYRGLGLPSPDDNRIRRL
nr:MAG TPA: hypothetical protein [Caudoviricetes sp.]